MNFLSRLICRRLPRSRSACVVAVAASVALACGPDFPNSYYDLPTEALLAAPEGFFAAEIARLTADFVPAHRAVKAANDDREAATREAELADLRRALAERGVDSRRAWEIELEFQRCRQWLQAQRVQAGDETERPGEAEPAVPSGVPTEFALYFAGAVAWQQGMLAEARARWEAVLALPARERRYRSTWASFMLGRLALRQDGPSRHEDAVRAFRQVRSLVASGFPDPLGLAAASLGWEARAALEAQDYPEAVRLYLEQYAAGDDTAIASLRYVAKALIRSPSEMRRLASDAGCRRVLTALFISRARYLDEGDESPEAQSLAAWANALREEGVPEVEEADRLAWLAYDLGQFDLAQQWLALAPEWSAEARWVRAKLALRRGELREGEELLREALASGALGDVHRSRVAAELGRVCLAQDDYAGALEAWCAGEHWEDAAYVAERVMSSAELIRFVDEHCAPDVSRAARANDWFGSNSRAMLRHLLARRLARAGEVERAQDYFPEDLRPTFAAYVADVRSGFDLERPTAERAASFWRAARAVRAHGMELLGTELEPDWAIWDGYFEMMPSVERRAGEPEGRDVFAPSPTELVRRSEMKLPIKRFHYRYRAAELAWWAASLMPNDSEETAEILHTAGGWLKQRDPEAAKPFYQALVIRCGHTSLGREASVRRWFADNP